MAVLSIVSAFGRGDLHFVGTSVANRVTPGAPPVAKEEWPHDGGVGSRDWYARVLIRVCELLVCAYGFGIAAAAAFALAGQAP